MLMPLQTAWLEDHIRTQAGLDFNRGRRRPPADRMIEMADYKRTIPSLEFLFNSVEPVKAMLVESVLAHPR